MSKPPIRKPKYKVGQVIGNLTILSVFKRPEKTGRACYYKCKCICGKTVDRSSQYFHKSKLLSCGCVNPCRQKDRVEAIFKALYQDKVGSDPRKWIKKISNISYEDFKRIILKPCYYCGLEYCMERTDAPRGTLISDSIVKYNGIDRIDSAQGYTIENSVPCCSKCNKAKGTLEKAEFLEWIKKIYEFNFRQK